jgi:ribosomal protein S18 acetylase RimI-like enzyme
MITIRQVDSDEDYSAVREQLGEYLQWVAELVRVNIGLKVDIGGMARHTESERAMFAPPEGRTLLALNERESVGIAFLKRLRPDAAEIKRMYVAPSYRGCGIGRALLDRLVAEARAIGYSRIFLDTGKVMTAAQRLYRSVGFLDIDFYAESEMDEEYRPHMVYMEKVL